MDKQRKSQFNKITGNFGLDFDSSNTFRDTGVNGISGSGGMGVVAINVISTIMFLTNRAKRILI